MLSAQSGPHTHKEPACERTRHRDTTRSTRAARAHVDVGILKTCTDIRVRAATRAADDTVLHCSCLSCTPRFVFLRGHSTNLLHNKQPGLRTCDVLKAGHGMLQRGWLVFSIKPNYPHVACCGIAILDHHNYNIIIFI